MLLTFYSKQIANSVGFASTKTHASTHIHTYHWSLAQSSACPIQLSCHPLHTWALANSAVKTADIVVQCRHLWGKLKHWHKQANPELNKSLSALACCLLLAYIHWNKFPNSQLFSLAKLHLLASHSSKTKPYCIPTASLTFHQQFLHLRGFLSISLPSGLQVNTNEWSH